MATASVTVRGTPDNPIFDFDIPQGEQGPPGGIVLGSLLTTIHLDTILASGMYRQDNASNVSTALGYPVNGVAGCLMVLERVVGATVFQIWHPILRPELTYKRMYSSGVWTPWKIHASARVDQTAGRVIYQYDDVNSREQIIYGDTGWRNVTADMINGFTSQLYIRRTNNTVFLEGIVLPPDPMVTGDFYQVPTAFQWTALVNVRVQGRMANSTDPFWLARKAPTSPLTVENINGSWVAGRGGFAISTSWSTAATWPTSLPGTAVGSVPNL